ncbi:MAG: tetratricopeptide repeat protein [Acidobacteria bacterium]|nr:tetratricopeptide repeat protein [Acidobacteriota bacterium]
MAPFLLILAAALAAFGCALAGSFHFDDYSLFTDAAVTSPAGWLAVWSPLRTRPITYLTFWANYQAGGQQPFGYHAVNLALHIACALLLWRVLVRLLPPRAALLAALLFAVHPIQSEPVAYVFARATLLMTLLCLLSLRAWLDGRRWMALLCFAAALLAKEECAAFPVVLVLLHLARQRPAREWRAIASMFVLALCAGLHLILITRLVPGSAAAFGTPVRPLDYLAGQGIVLWRYARLLVVPSGLTVDPDPGAAPLWLACLGWAAIALLVAAALRTFRAHPVVMWLLAGLILLLPVSSVIPVADLAADRRLYLPMLALCAAAGLLLVRIPPRAIVPLFAVLIALSVARMQAWQTEESLWSEAVRRSPGKIRPKLQLARAAEPATALRLLEDARLLAPDDPRVAAEIGACYLSHHRADLALREFGRALALEPRNPLALNNRGAALAALRQTEAARLDFEQALTIDPCLAGAHDNLRLMGVASEAPVSCPPAR